MRNYLYDLGIFPDIINKGLDLCENALRHSQSMGKLLWIIYSGAENQQETCGNQSQEVMIFSESFFQV